MADVEVSAVTADSRQVQPGCLFIAIRGYTVDGHQFAAESVRKGACAVLVEEPLPGLPVPQVVVPDTRLASAVVASVFYNHPSHHLRVVGVTGTSGKTTVTHVLAAVLQSAGREVGLYGTVGKRIRGQVSEAVNTTPEAVELQAVLHEMVSAGCQYAVLEVSSHALELRRTAGTRVHAAVFTNLTQDHLDFHGTMEAYRAAKGKLFSRLGNSYGDDRASQPYAVINADDPAGEYMAQQTVMECLRYGLRADADVRAEDLELRPDGARFRLRTWRGDADVSLPLPGRFNVANALAAVAVAVAEGLSPAQVAQGLAQVQPVPGRLQRVGEGYPVTVLVDYAHKPDSLQQALATVRELTRGRVGCVVGCGGDRDRSKRPVMARIACAGADWVVFTSDNPRSEDPDLILDEMVAGVSEARNWVRIRDRQEAIAWAVAEAQPGDVVLVAGKGHETYQLVGREKLPFDDRAVALAALVRRFGPTAETSGGERPS
ncbi:MAG: UDP-N-acetylmuramoyl-L-alanyl-D-glutamate--2,6-diaminopimelate ligase [Alicyclobacillus sp.]|nr:UDP-N-acetylmuramoyl-L-alanyl-D-glutamate--2,6-diaminopimelate ligase [Alicyclobacillus sp.]